MWTKLRPGVHEFLRQASHYYQLWIHTNGGWVLCCAAVGAALVGRSSLCTCCVPAAPPPTSSTSRNPLSPTGNRSYAECVTRLLDPDGSLFGGRLIAQGAERAEQMVPDQAKRLMQAGGCARCCACCAVLCTLC